MPNAIELDSDVQLFYVCEMYLAEPTDMI